MRVKIGSRALAVGHWKNPTVQLRAYGEKKPLEGS